MTKNILALLFAAAVAVCARADAAGLPLETLPANARWALHLDVKALRDAPLGKEILASLTNTPAEAELRNFETTFAVDIRRDVSSVTACGAGSAEQGGVVYLRGNWNLRKLSAVLADNNQLTSAPYGRHTLLSWHDAKAAEGFERENVCLVSSNLVLLGNRETAMKQALDALDGKAPVLATVPRFRRMAALDTNAFLRVIALDLKDIVADNPQAATLPAADSLRLALSSEGQAVRLKAVIRTLSPEAALQLHQSLIGLQTIGILQVMKIPALGQVAQAARIGVNDLDVSVVVTVPVDAVKHLLLQPKAHKATRAPAEPAQPPTPDPAEQ